MQGTGVFCWAWDTAGAARHQIECDGQGRLEVVQPFGLFFNTHCHGYDGAAWQTMLVESAANFNLRVRLYEGANPITAGAVNVASHDPTGLDALDTRANLYLWRNANNSYRWGALNVAVDGTLGYQIGAVGGWAYNGATWDRLRTEAAGVPNLRTRLYAGANAIYEQGSVANIAFTEHGLFTHSLVWGEHAANLQPIQCRNLAFDAVSTGGIALNVRSFLHGFNGADWDRLRTEAAGVPNLRVRLYDGANPIDADLLSAATIPDASYALDVNACLRVSRAGANNWSEVRSCQDIGDAEAGARMVPVGLWGFNGAQFVRLRTIAPSDAVANPSFPLKVINFNMGYDPVAGSWERLITDGSNCLRTLECTSDPGTSGVITSSQIVHNGKAHMYGITISKATAQPVTIEIHDGPDASGPVMYRVVKPGLEPWAKQFRPWLMMYQGIYLSVSGAGLDSVIIEFGGI